MEEFFIVVSISEQVNLIPLGPPNLFLVEKIVHFTLKIRDVVRVFVMEVSVFSCFKILRELFYFLV